VEEEGVLEMIENLVECLPPGRDPLGSQIGRELRDAEERRRVSEESADHPARARHVHDTGTDAVLRDLSSSGGRSSGLHPRRRRDP
jgi:hypothetical protein